MFLLLFLKHWSVVLLIIEFRQLLRNIFNPTAELVIPKGIQTTKAIRRNTEAKEEAKEEMETHMAIVEV